MSQKYDLIAAEEAYGKFLNALGFDWKNDPHMEDTPHRVAKAWVNDLAKGCFMDEPKITAFTNNGQYDGMVCQTNIPVVSMCAHHNLPFFGYGHLAYLPDPEGKVIGLSKLNRVVDYFSRRPQVQENLTMEIHKFLDDLCKGNLGVAVMVEANHTCCSMRGIKQNSTMRTAKMSGAFRDPVNNSRNEFYKFVEFAQGSRSLV
jgi:GTP cyclohydrolase I